MPGARFSLPFAAPHDPLARLLLTLAFAFGVILVVLILTYLLSRFAAGKTRSWLQRAGFQENTAILLGRAAWAATWTIGSLIILYQFGVGLTPLTAFIGVVGLAASLSLQQVLQNLVAGIYLLAERPFRIGDVIAVVGPAGLNHVGRVEDIEIRTTHLRSQDNELILVPNSAIFAGVITNRTVIGGYAIRVSATFPRSTDLDAVRTQVGRIVVSVPNVLATPIPEFRMTSVGGVTWTACLTFWATHLDAETGAMWELARAFPDVTLNDGGAVT
jgi:small-conductance mechanosensitive channel